MSDYLSVTYNEVDRPFTSYPRKLTKYLFDFYNLEKKNTLLDIGTGRGEFLQGFSECGLNTFGVDQFDVVKDYFPENKITICDLENEKLPFEDNYFDVVFSKSVIEHFYHPEKLAKEMLRVLKPGGIAITLTPDWHYNYREVYDDYTHRTPFTKTSLNDFFLIHNFNNLKVTRFKQLPILWKGSTLLSFLSEISRIFFPTFLKRKSKWIRFSKEIMLLSSAFKPK